jgi:hypothetical protein
MNSYMKRTGYPSLIWGVLSLIVLSVTFGATAHADTFNSTNFTIDASTVGNSVGGAQSSSNYQLVSSGGDSVIGNGASGSYKLGEGYVAQLDKSLQLTVQPSGLIGHYSFDQGTGTQALDESVNSNPALFQGTPTWATGKLNGGLSGFSAANYLKADYSSTYNVANLTVCSWLNLTASSSNPVAVGRSLGTPDTDGMWLLGFNGGSTPRVRMYANGIHSTLASNAAVGTGTWNQVCFTYGGADLILYVNGIETNRVTLNDPMDSFTQALTIGVVSNGSQPLNGIVDEVKLYSRILTAREVEAEYDAQVAGFPSGLSLNAVTPGVSQTSEFDVISQTDAPGYNLSINQNQNLTSGGNSISAVSGSIASPVTWSEGTTKGLGFTLFGTNATAIPGSWSSGNAYAALPGSATSFYTRTGFTAGAKDVLNMRLRLDVNSSQPSGDYTNQMTITGTMTP